GQEFVYRVGGQVHRVGAGLPQRAGEFGIDRAGPPEFGQQQLVRPVQPAPQAVARRPDLFGRHQQARVLDRLQQELQPPAAPVLGGLFRVGGGREVVGAGVEVEVEAVGADVDVVVHVVRDRVG